MEILNPLFEPESLFDQEEPQRSLAEDIVDRLNINRNRSFFGRVTDVIRAPLVIGDEVLDHTFGEADANIISSFADIGMANMQEFAGKMFEGFGRIGEAGAGVLGDTAAYFASPIVGVDKAQQFQQEWRQALARARPDRTGWYQVADWLYGLAEENRRVAQAATGVLARGPESFLDYLDPRRALITFNENVPTLAFQAGAALMGGGIFALAVGSSTGEEYLSAVEQHEAETGQSVNPWIKAFGAATVIAGNVVLERLGLKSIGNAARIVPHQLRRQVMVRLLGGAAGEGVTESIQELLNSYAEAAYQDAPVSAFFSAETVNRAIQGFYGGFVVGGGAGVVTQRLAALGTPADPVQVLEFKKDDQGILRPVFRVNDPSLPHYGETLSLAELQAANIPVPRYERALLKAQFLEGRDNITEEQAEVAMRLVVDLPAQNMGLTPDDYVMQTQAVGWNDRAFVGDRALWQENPLHPMWNSRLVDALSVAGRLPKEATPRQVRDVINNLQNKGLYKAEEVEWTGVIEWLELLPEDAVVSGQEVVDFIKNNGVQVLEVFKSRYPPALQRIKDKLAVSAPAQGFEYIWEAVEGAILDQDLARLQELNASGQIPREVFTDILNFWAEGGPDGAAQSMPVYEEYTIKGGTNYRELLLTLPHRKTGREFADEYNALSQQLRAKYGDGFRNVATPEELAELDRLSRLSDPDGPTQGNFTTPHFPGIENILAHVRLKDRQGPNGERILFVEELQSDWHQAGQERGYRKNPRERIAAEARLNELSQSRTQLEQTMTRLYMEANQVFGRMLKRYGVENDYQVAEYGAWQWLKNNHPDDPDLAEYSNLLTQRAEVGRQRDAVAEEISALSLELDETGSVPNAPFKGSGWVDLALKRIMRLAVDEGYDSIFITNGREIANIVGGPPDALFNFYNRIIPSRLKKVSKENVSQQPLPVDRPTLYEVARIPDSENWGLWHTEQRVFTDFIASTEAEAREAAEALNGVNTPTPLGHELKITPELRDRVLAGLPLYQGQKGAFEMLETGHRVITLMEQGNVTTLVHELAHLLRSALPADVQARLSEAYGLDPDAAWGRKHEEHFARSLERLLREGELEGEGLAREKKLLESWFQDIYTTVIGSEIDVDISPEVRAVFEEMFSRTVPPEGPKSQADKAKMWDRFMNHLSVERLFRKAGQERTGSALRLFFSEEETHMMQGLRVYEQVLRTVGRRKDQFVEALLAYERGDDPDSLPPRIKEATALLREYFSSSLSEYKRLGGLREGFVERVQRELEAKITKLMPDNLPVGLVQDILYGDVDVEVLAQYMPNKKKNLVQAQALAALGKQMRDAESLQYLHIPYQIFSQMAERNPTGARKVLRILAETRRGTFSLNQLIADGVISRNDIDPADLISSYASRKGRDIALLRIRQAAVMEGAARRLIGKERPSNEEDYFDAGHPVFKGYEVNGPLQAWLREMSSLSPFGIWQRIVRTAKVMAFYNPTVMSTYNVIQLGMAAAHNPLGLAPAVVRGLTSYFRRDDAFWERMHEGLSSQPFALPWVEFRKRFDNVDDSLWRRALLGLTTGAAVGSVVPGVGTVLGAKAGLVAALARPERAILRAGVAAYDRMKGDETVSITRSLFGAPVEMVKNVYAASWDATWSFDLMLRNVLAEYYEGQGLSRKEAATLSSEVFGDYAAIPLKTRRMLNSALFTPTYKFAMARLFNHVLGSAGQVMTGRGGVYERNQAMIIVNTFGILYGADFLLTAILDWERDEFGRRYFKRTVVENPERLNVGSEQELTITFGGPHDVLFKHFTRLQHAFGDPLVRNPVAEYARQNRWELNPALNLLLDISKGVDKDGEPFFRSFEDPSRGYTRLGKYALTHTVQILQPFFGEEMDAQGRELFEQHYGSWRELVSGALVFKYARNPREIAIAQAMDRQAAELDRALAPVRDAIRAGLTQQELADAVDLDLINEKIRNFERNITALEEEMDLWLWRRERGDDPKDGPVNDLQLQEGQALPDGQQEPLFQQ